MNQDDVKKVLPLLQAYADGKTLQMKLSGERWEDCSGPTLNPMLEFPDDYRIKPEPRRFTLLVSTSKHHDGAGRVIEYRPEVHDACRTISSGWWEEVEVVEVLNG